MKYLGSIKSIVLSSFLVGLLLIISCSDDDPTTSPEDELEQARQEILEILSSQPWEVSSVAKEGVDASVDYEEFQIEIKDGTYRTQNGGQAWPESGTWEFVEGESSKFRRDDGVVLTVEVKGDDVEISFTYPEDVFSKGRTKTVQTFIAFLLKELAGLFGS